MRLAAQRPGHAYLSQRTREPFAHDGSLAGAADTVRVTAIARGSRKRPCAWIKGAVHASSAATGSRVAHGVRVELLTVPAGQVSAAGPWSA